MKKFSVTNLTTHIWSIFIGLIFLIFLCLFIFHSFFYQQFYDSFKRTELINVANLIQKDLELEGLNESLNQIAASENLKIAIFKSDKNGIDELYNPDSSDYSSYLNFIENEEFSAEIFREELESTDIFVYICKLNVQSLPGYYMYVSSPIEGSTIAYTINQYQIIISASIAMCLGVLIAFFSSRYLSKPIRDLNNAAFLLSNGNYDVNFPNEGYDEIKELGESLNKAKDELMKTHTMQKEFIANVSHDLRTPLTLIQSYAEMIRDLSGDNKEKREEHLSVIISETNRLSSLVTDVLELTKLQQKQKEIIKEKVNLSNLINAVLVKLKLPISENKIKLINNVNKKIFADVDEVAFNQVVYNFILNAITYTNTTIEVNLYVEDNKIYFNVIDDGDGISEDEVNNIWERYYRSKENHERHKHGSGLGLSIVKNILEDHKFKFGVESKVYEGSKFYVILPYDYAKKIENEIE